MLLLALSCLQGRPMQAAAEELLGLGPDGLQLTAGCAPTPAFAAWVGWRGVPVRKHDGFSWVAPRQQVWSTDGLAVDAESVHPALARAPFAPWLDDALRSGVAVEVMYPGWLLGDGAQVCAAMDAGLPLAVDVSHLALQVEAEVISGVERARLLDYDDVREIHVSANDGRADRHWVPDSTSYGLDWARERAQSGTPVVCESYLHRIPQQGRQALVELMRERVSA